MSLESLNSLKWTFQYSDSLIISKGFHRTKTFTTSLKLFVFLSSVHFLFCLNSGMILLNSCRKNISYIHCLLCLFIYWKQKYVWLLCIMTLQSCPCLVTLGQLVRMLCYELVCLCYICSVAHWESVFRVELWNVWLEYRVCFSDRMKDHTYTCVAM